MWCPVTYLKVFGFHTDSRLNRVIKHRSLATSSTHSLLPTTSSLFPSHVPPHSVSYSTSNCLCPSLAQHHASGDTTSLACSYHGSHPACPFLPAMNGVTLEKCTTALERTCAIAFAKLSGSREVDETTARRFPMETSLETPSQPHVSVPFPESDPVPGPVAHCFTSRGNSTPSSESPSSSPSTSTTATEVRIALGSSG